MRSKIQHITVTEYNEITGEYAEIIEAQECKGADFAKFFSSSWGKIYTSNYCGSIHLDEEHSITILPKISDSKEENWNYLIFMLSYVYDLSLYRDFATVQTKRMDIFEVLIAYFAETLKEQVMQGLHFQYITKEENLTKLKGKYLVSDNIKHNFTKTRMFCQFDEFSEDNYLNQVFLFAVRLLVNYTKNSKTRKNLIELISFLAEVDYVQYNTTDLDDNFCFTRQNERFKRIYELTLFILRRLVADFRCGKKKNFAFLFDMNELFERFIGKLISETCPEGYRVRLQKTARTGGFNIRPDIIILRGATPELVIDTKYKLIQDNGRVTPCDLYQVYAYGMALPKWISGIRRVMLLYPAHSGKQIEFERQLGNRDYPETIVNLDVRQFELKIGESGYKRYIKETKDKIEEEIWTKIG